MSITRPLLASAVENLEDLRFPVYATPKLDGIRCLKVNGKVVTRNFKEFPNVYTRELLEKVLPDGIDGEVMLRNDSPFNTIQSELMSYEGEPDFVYNAFDYVKESLDKAYLLRIDDLMTWYEHNFKDVILPVVKLVLPLKIESLDELTEIEHKYLERGYEGVMIRHPYGKYKCGRSTIKEGILLKIKQFKDAEAVVIGFQEKLHNSNQQEENEFGLAKRSSKKDGMVAAGTLGALVVEDPSSKQQFNIGTGYDDDTRKEIWDHQEKYIGKFVTYKFQEFGAKDLPRFPVFKGFRDARDM